MVKLALTPGHTAGTLAVLVPVRHLGRTHTALILSGTQMPTRESLAVYEHVFDDVARLQKAETALGAHPGILMNTLELLEDLRQRYPVGPHPLVLGEEAFGRYLSIVLECARARLAALESDGS